MENNNKTYAIFILGILIISIFIISINAETPAFTSCCEKTKKGVWCQNTEESNCDNNFQKTPTSCEATSFCKPGCCVDSKEGLCMENTPEKVCSNSQGTWFDNEECNIPQCNLGCCILGEQASFVTLTRCKRLSALYGLTTNFRKNINSEENCILLTQLQDRGACVYESEFKRTCKFTTRDECSKIKVSGNVTSKPVFYKDYLCSAEELATDCGPTQETMCIEGKEEVYFKDSCGNPANIYDQGKMNDKEYWKKIIPKSNTCGFNSVNGNANSRTCGNCDYFRGSICKKGAASYGDYSCANLNCGVINGKPRKNGESWCEYQGKVGDGRDAVGSRHFRHICINGEEIIEACDDFRAKVCIEGTIETNQGDFIEAGCVVNRWKDCVAQSSKYDCENTDQRDCYWREGYYFTSAGISEETTNIKTTVPAKGGPVFGGGTPVTFGGGNTGGFSGGTTGKMIASSFADATEGITGFATSEQGTQNIQSGGGACLPNNPPGLKFWNSAEASGICNIGSNICIVTYEKGLLEGGEGKCKKDGGNCDCENPNGNWAKQMNDICTSLGDCGAYANLVGEFSARGAEFKVSGKRKVLDGLYADVKTKSGL